MPRPIQSSTGISGMLRPWNGETRKSILENLIPVIYDELHRQAHSHLRRERRNRTLQTTDLINEAYLKLCEQQSLNVESRTQFFAIASNLMRQILIDHARKKRRLKRGGVNSNLPLEEAVLLMAEGDEVDLVALDEALSRLSQMDPQQGRIVELKYFAGLSIDETAEILHVSKATVKRDWNVARIWLHRELNK